MYEKEVPFKVKKVGIFLLYVAHVAQNFLWRKAVKFCISLHYGQRALSM